MNSCCENPSENFGQPPLLNVVWRQSLSYINLLKSGIIGTPTGAVDANGNPILTPTDLTGCQLDCYINDPNDGSLVIQWSSGGISPAFVLVDQAIYPNPNYTLSVSNAVLNDLFTARVYNFQWILTDAADEPSLLMAGQIIFFIPSTPPI